MKTRAQEWSARAFEKVRKAAGGGDRDKYRTACMKMPSLIHQSGLLQALVFITARDDAGRTFVSDLAVTLEPTSSHEKLIGQAQAADLVPYLKLSREVSDIAQWFRRFAQIELPRLEKSS
jgi:CRISPR type III-B/RAMP module-associated protein Cmr5